MENIKKLILSYKETYLSLENGYKSYAVKDFNVTSLLDFNLKMESEINLFIELKRLIDIIVKLYDSTEEDDISLEDKGLISGLKFINNNLNHEEWKLSVEDFVQIQAVYKLDNQVNKNTSIYDIHFKFTFDDVLKIPINKQWGKQRAYYVRHLYGKDILQIIQKSDMIIRQKYDLE